MAKLENEAKTEGGAGPSGPFEAFLRAVRAFAALWCEAVTSQSGEKDRAAVMRLYQEAILNAWDGAAHDLSQLYQRLDPEARTELNRAVATSGMLQLVEHASSLVSSGQLASTTSLLDLGTIFEKIKAFILCILDCLGIQLPCIIRCLFDLIDNLIRIFLGPVSRDYADYYFKIEEQAFQVRLHSLQEQKLRRGCSCAG
jgi:hypothetical protein